MSEVRVKVKLTFPESDVRRPVLATLVRQFDVDPNIRRADVEEHRGWIVCEMDGQSAQVEAALDWLRGEGIHVVTGHRGDEADGATGVRDVPPECGDPVAQSAGQLGIHHKAQSHGPIVPRARGGVPAGRRGSAHARNAGSTRGIYRCRSRRSRKG